MLVAEAPIRILNKMVDRVVIAFRGYSAQDLRSATRVFGGNITPDDRARFIQDELSRLSLIHSGPIGTPGSLDFNYPTFLSLGISEFIEEVRSIQNLPADQLDPIIISRAERNLKRWGKL